MRILVPTTVLWLIGCVLGAQTTLNDDAVVKLLKAGLSDDLIISTVNAAPGIYDTSADALMSLKAAGASDKLISIIAMKASSQGVADQSQLPVGPPSTGPGLTESYAAPRVPAASTPRVFLQSASKGTNQSAARDQSMEMSKDIERDCPGMRVTVNSQMADYTIMLNHIEIGFVRDNQIQVANKDGDLLSRTKEGGSIAGGMKRACALILADWSKR